MERVLSQAGSDVTQASFSSSWEKLWSLRILNQADGERSSNSRLRNVMSTLEEMQVFAIAARDTLLFHVLFCIYEIHK